MAGNEILIIGGGFSGASAAVQLARKIEDPLAITIVEPAPLLGPGLAYSCTDPTFRLNAISGAHSIDVADPGHFTRWCEKERLSEADPEALVPSGELFARRRDFGRYLTETVADHASLPNGTRIEHRRARATHIDLSGEHPKVALDDGTTQRADVVIIATGNPPMGCPAVISGTLEGYPGIHANPLVEGTGVIAPDARVLVVGAGLTALDVIASLVGRSHRGTIAAISRRGLRPHEQAPHILNPPPDPPPPPVVPLELLEGELPPYATAEKLTALGLLEGVREATHSTEREGKGWQLGFDALAMPLSRIWPRLPLAEKQRVLRHLRPQYDAHRFRSPPMTDAAVKAAEAAGQVSYRKARLAEVTPGEDGIITARLRLSDGSSRDELYDAIVNCTGFDRTRQLTSNSLLAGLAEREILVPHPTGLGIVVDRDCRVVTASGAIEPRLRVIGPLTAGVFGDPLGVFFISAQIHRVIPALAGELGLRISAGKQPVA